ncbi:MAG: LPS assembly protein LptD [Methylococcales bacterium]|nr:LPS assembly protein LptD [Methylococcales bacterium]
MNRHLVVVSLLIYAPFNFAATADWNCQKNEAGEWSCITQLPSSSQPVETEGLPSENTQTQVKKPLAEPTLPVISTQKDPVPVPKIEQEINVKLATDPAPISAVVTPNAIMNSPVAAPPKQAANPDGWNCLPNTQDKNWDCQLVGVDPKGKKQTIENESQAGSIFLDPAFNRQQESAFKNLLTEFSYDPWGQCDSRQPIVKSRMPRKHLRESTPLDITSDHSELLEGEITGFSGNVEMRRADQHLRASKASYDTVSDMMDTQGQVYYSEDGLALFSNSASLHFATDQSILRDVLFISLDGPIRGSADVAYRDSDMLSHYKEASYTSCRPGNQDWIIHADRFKMNKKTGLGAATNAWLEFKGVPLLYTPYINFPIDDRRTSGLLFPSWGSNEENGVDIEIPFYWNIAPNFDATIRPRYLSKRGALLGGEFRYLTGMTRGSVGIEYMPYDELRDRARYHGQIKNLTQFAPGLSADIDLNYISDDDYLDELGDTLSISDRRHVRSRADLRYQQQGISFLARGESYQTIDRTIPNEFRPYLKLPELSLNLAHSFDSTIPVDLDMNNSYTNFYRSNSVTGHRFNTKPSISLPIIGAGSYITPKLSFQYTQYELNNQLAGKSNSISRGLPIASVDSGLFFEKSFKFGSSNLLHTIEPRVFYLYVPETNQDDIPIFDTALNDFTYNSLFREYSYSGLDRIQNTNQLSVGLSSRIINSNTGMEYLKLGIGEIFYFADRTAVLPGQKIETNRLSNLVTELSGRFNEHLSFSTNIQWDPYENKFTRGHAGLQFINRPDQIINLGYHYRQNELIQSDVSFRWPIYDNWYAVGRWQYSLKFNTTKESFIGLEKESCCWRFRVVGRKYINAISANSEAKLQTGIFVQLELKGLSNFGDKVEEFLAENISGYEKPQ